MKKARILQSAGSVLLYISSVYSFYNENAIRCQLFGINYNDCIGSVYRPSPTYDSYIKSFNLPIHKDDACAYSICKAAVLGSGENRFISIAQNAHPPGACLCLGSAHCGCDTVAISPPQLKTIYQVPMETITPTHLIVTQTVSHTKTVVVKVTEPPAEKSIIELEPTSTPMLPLLEPGNQNNIAQQELLIKLSKQIELLTSDKPETRPKLPNYEMVQTSQSEPIITPGPLSVPDVQQHGSIITIPYSTTTTTVQVTVPVYKTKVRTQYVVNTVDNFTTETLTKTQTKTVTTTKNKTLHSTVTETISDHVERTKFRTVYMPKTVTVDKTSTFTSYLSKTTTVTSIVKPTKLVNSITPAETSSVEKNRGRISLSSVGIGSKRPSRGTEKKYFIVQQEIKNKLVCRQGCTNPKVQLSGECPIGSIQACPPAHIQPGFNVSMLNKREAGLECKDANCTELVKTIYVNATETLPKPKQIIQVGQSSQSSQSSEMSQSSQVSHLKTG
ncbi:hypothetical protein NEAUS04_0981 [Nematocida ausubeli]|nr:hypothetical protein NEAUS04_0981 [Nematocida ausubeli]